MLELLNRPKQLSRQRNVFHQNCVRIPWMYATAWDTADLETRYWLVKSTMQFRSRWVSGARHHLLGRASWRVWLVSNIFIVQLVDLSSWSAREMCPTWPFGHLWHQGNRLLNKGHGALASQHTPHCGIESTIHPWTWSHCNRSLWCCYSDGSIVDTIKSNPFLSSIKDKNRWFIKPFLLLLKFLSTRYLFFFLASKKCFRSPRPRIQISSCLSTMIFLPAEFWNFLNHGFPFFKSDSMSQSALIFTIYLFILAYRVQRTDFLSKIQSTFVLRLLILLLDQSRGKSC